MFTCCMAKPKDITGRTFGRLTALRSIQATARGYIWKFRCSCGRTLYRHKAWVLSGNTLSCGCLRKDAITKHGYQKGVMNNRKLRNLSTKVYTAYHAMRQRCLNPRSSGYKNYGGRGIKICSRWLNSFVNFAEDVGFPPSYMHTIGRIDNEGGYKPSNVGWFTRKEQMENTRRSNLITIGTKTLCLTAWAKKSGLKISCLRSRQKRGIIGAAFLDPVLK